MTASSLAHSHSRSLSGSSSTSLLSSSPSASSASSQLFSTTNSIRMGRQSNQGNRVKVCVRVRPLFRKELVQPGGKKAWSCHENTLYQRIFPPIAVGTIPSAKKLPTSYKFDHLYTPSSTTEEIYDDNVKDMVLAAMEGYHSSVFAYGQNGSGKSYTMHGQGGEPGIISFALQQVFEYIDTHPDMDFLLRLSYLEICDEIIYDLLVSDAKSDIRIDEFDAEDPYETGIKDVVIKGAREEIVTSFQNALSLVREGNFHRHMAITENNEKSSHSHTVLRIMIESQEIENQGIRLSSPVRTSTLSLVDLAGSDCLEPKRMDKSLTTLDQIITKMSKVSHDQRSTLIALDVPFGNSKLTRLLKPSLAGKAQVAIICTIISSLKSLDESHKTLKFASRARRLRHHAAINKTVNSEYGVLKKYRARIRYLENQLKELELRRSHMIPARSEGNVQGSGHGGVQAKLNLATIKKREVELKHAINSFNRAILHSSQRDLKISSPHNNQVDCRGHHEDKTADEEVLERTSSSQTVIIDQYVSPSINQASNVQSEHQEHEPRTTRSDPSSHHPMVASILKARYMNILAELQCQERIKNELTKQKILHDIIQGLEIVEAEQKARLSKLHDLEEQNQHLLKVLHARERELMALKKISMENETF